MPKVEPDPTVREPGARGAAASATATASAWENLTFNLVHILPGIVQGTFLRRPFWVGLSSRLHPDPTAVRFIGRMHRKYGSGYIRVSLLGRKALLVLDVEGIRRVLDQSPDVYADSRVKRLGMSHFQPEALTISRGDAWRERRRFNEAVLATERPLHPQASAFLDLAREEVDAIGCAGGRLGWPEFARLFDRLALGVVFGREARDSASLSERLTRLMRESNRIFGLKESRDFQPFYEEIHARLAAPAEGSLAELCPHARPVAATSADTQIPHWMFALRDTLATNTLHAMALIVSHPDVEARVRAELVTADTATPEGVGGLRYLEMCLDEAMRLWPSTPMIVREAAVDGTLNGDRVAAGTPVIIHNGFNHRDPESVPDADRFLPERWASGGADYRFNHMSNGPQSCVGRGLALFLARAVVAALLEGGRYRLVRPALRPDRPLPQAVDCYRIVLARDTGDGSRA